MSVDYILDDSAVGFSVYKVVLQPDTIGSRLKEVQEKARKLESFGKLVELVSFVPFQSTQHALENQNVLSEGILSDYLKETLQNALPKAGKKKSKITLGLLDKNLAGSIKEAFSGVECETADTSEVVADLLRGAREHGPKLVKKLNEGDVERSQLGLGHAYSRAKVKFSVQKNDNHIMQAIATLDQLDKACNTFGMRVREWYGWHFPELIKIVSDNQTYAKMALFIKNKSTLSADSLHDLAEQVDDDKSIAQDIIDAARVSMGRDLSETDMANFVMFAERAVKLFAYRKRLALYLGKKMGLVAPNLKALMGEIIGARLISKAGSLTNLSKMPASTLQILGAEKALFRALKTKGNTPKYGIIYHSSFIGRTGTKNKGRISRYIANKCAMASRIDNFSEVPSSKFGEALKAQVEERMEFYTTGKAPIKNSLVMQQAMDAVLGDINIEDPTAGATEDVEMVDGVTSGALEQERRKKAKGEKKDKKRKSEGGEEVVEKKKKRKSEGAEDGEKKKKKKSKA